MTVEVRIYGPSGTGAYLVPTRRRGVQWLDELNAWGTGTVQVHASDPTLLANPDMLGYGRVVKLYYAGAERFAFRIEKRDTAIVTTEEEAGRWTTVSGRGVTALLGDAVVYPEYGLSRDAGEERAFTFASKVGDWYEPSEWAAPVGVLWPDDNTPRSGYPRDWADPDAEWIWPTDPLAALPGGEVAFFRTTLVAGSAQTVQIQATADNVLDLYLDGEPIIATDRSELYAWKTTYRYTADLSAGSHILAARVENTALKDGAFNPAGFLCSVFTTDAVGEPVAPVRRSDTTHWLCHSGTPGWRAAHVLATLLDEAQARGVTAAGYLSVDFDETLDSAGVAWTDRQPVAFRIGTDTLLDVAAKLTEAAIDLAVESDMVLRGWKRRGTDKTGTVTLAKGVSLVDHRADGTAPSTTRLLMRTATGWLEQAAASEGTWGRKEGAVQLGSAQSDDAAAAVAAGVFAETSTPQTVIESGQMPARTGATPYVDFGIGDDVTTLAEDGVSDVEVRVSALAVSEDDDGNVWFTPELYS